MTTQKCSDKKCPIHGQLSTRGFTIVGTVKSAKTKNTAIVTKDYLRFIPKYERYERRKTRVSAHIPACITVKAGDRVKLGECRKLSKTKSFVVLEVIKE